MSEWQETEYGRVPYDWNFVSASTYCGKVTDGTHDSPKQQISGKHLITSKHIKGRHIDFENAYLISQTDYEKINERSKVDQWNVIISMIGEYCGFSYVERNEKIDYAVKNVGIFKTQSRANALWLHYYIQSKIGREYLESVRGGTSQPYLSLGALREFPVLVPTNIEEQKTITAVLSSLDDKIDLLHRQNQTLEAMAATLFRQWFVEEVQEDWEEFSVTDFAVHIKSNVVPAKFANEQFYHYSLPAFDEGQEPALELGSEILSNKYEVVEHSILVSKLNPRVPRIWPIGALPGKNAICSTEFQVFKPKNPTLYGYLYFLLRSGDAVDALTMAASGTSGSHQRVRPEDILNIRTSLPSFERAEQFSELAMPGIEKARANRMQIRTLSTFRDTLLSKLMSGEVRVVV